MSVTVCVRRKCMYAARGYSFRSQRTLLNPKHSFSEQSLHFRSLFAEIKHITIINVCSIPIWYLILYFVSFRFFVPFYHIEPLNRKCIINIFHVDLGLFLLDISPNGHSFRILLTSHVCAFARAHSTAAVCERLSNWERDHHLVIILMFRCHIFKWSDRLHAHSFPLHHHITLDI